jgi:hypothetical protein
MPSTSSSVLAVFSYAPSNASTFAFNTFFENAVLFAAPGLAKPVFVAASISAAVVASTLTA